MKKVVKFLTIVVILSLFCLPVHASQVADDYINEFEGSLPDGYSGLTENDELLDSLIGPEAVLSEILSALGGGMSGAVAFFLMLLGGVALVAASSVREGAVSSAAGTGTSVLLASLAASRMAPIFAEVSAELGKLSDFFALLVPIATGIQVSSGAPNTAAAAGVGMNITVSVLSRLGTPFFITLASLGLVIGLLSAFGDESIASLSSSVKGFFMWSVGLVCALVMGAISLQTIIASARDSAAMRAAKYAATSLIPVVGGTVSGAMATLATGLSYAKSVIGVGAVAVILSICISPLVMLLLYRTAASVAASLCSYLGIVRAEKTLSAVRLSFDLYIAVYSISVVVYIFQIALFMMCGVSG